VVRINQSIEPILLATVRSFSEGIGMQDDCRRSDCASSPECFMSQPHGASTDAKKGARNAQTKCGRHSPATLWAAAALGQQMHSHSRRKPGSSEPIAGAAPSAVPSSAAGNSSGRGAAPPAEPLGEETMAIAAVTRSRSRPLSSAARTLARSAVSRACQGAVRCRGRRRRETRLSGRVVHREPFASAAELATASGVFGRPKAQPECGCRFL
jgi:hypothetical protein